MSGVPYSDDMYSGGGLDSDADDDLYAALTGNGGNNNDNNNNNNGNRSDGFNNEELSPSDGFYGGRQEHVAGVGGEDALYHRHHGYESSQRQQQPQHPQHPQLPQSSQVPRVPDVWVTDPSLVHGSTAESKAREAQEERDQARRLASSYPSSHHAAFPSLPTSPPSSDRSFVHQHLQAGPPSSSAYYPPYLASPSSSARLTQQIVPSPLLRFPSRHHQQQLSQSSYSSYPYPSAASASAGPRRSASISSERSSLLSEPPPPAYTPSPTSPPSSSNHWSSFNYQTVTSPLLPRHGSNSGRSSNISPGTTSANNHNNMGRPSESERHGLLAGQTYQAIPQSMGGDPNGADDDMYNSSNGHNNGNSRHEQRAPRWRRIRHIKLVALVLVLLFVTVGFLVSSFSSIKKAEKGSPFPGKDITSPGQGSDGPNSSNPQIPNPGLNPGPNPTPIPNPNIPITRPILDNDGTRLAYPIFDDPLKFQASQMCGSQVTKVVNLAFNNLIFSRSRNITLTQTIKPHDDDSHPNGRDVRVSGDVIIRRAGPGTPWASLTVESISNDDRIQVGLDWEHTTQELRILTPRSIPNWSGSISPCVQVRVTLWVPPESVIGMLNFQGIHLGLQLLDNLSLSVANFARFASTVGPITAATDGEKDKSQLMHGIPPASFNLESRYIEVKTTSAAISGSWPLYDYLGLESTSGSIHAGVRPQTALVDKPVPAILYAKSTSGRVELYEPIAETSALWTVEQQQLEQIGEKTELDSTTTTTTTTMTAKDLIPPREYDVNIRTMSGAVTADLAFGHACRVHTTSGNIDLTLLPVFDQRQAQALALGGAAASDGSTKPTLETASTSGTTNVRVLDALWWTTATSSGANGVYVVPPSPPSNEEQQQQQPPQPPPVQFIPIGERDPYSNANLEQRSAIAGESSHPALRILSSRHATTSAKISVIYPDAWEGYIDADSLSGSINLSGRGVQIIRRDDFGGISKHVLAHKGKEGEDGGTIKLHSTSGNIQCAVGPR